MLTLTLAYRLVGLAWVGTAQAATVLFASLRTAFQYRSLSSAR